MAVPKKRTSKSKTNKRKTVWKKIALKASIRAYSMSKNEKNARSKKEDIDLKINLDRD